MIEKFVQVGSHKIRYIESGSSSKRVLVLVHGLGASAERWEYVMPELSKKYRVIAPDLLGFGYSDKPLLDYTPQFFAKFLSDFLETIGISHSSMIGSSLGGQIVSEYAITYHKKTENIILVSPAGVMKYPTPALEAYIAAALYPSRDSAHNAFQMMSGVDEKIPSHIIDDFIKRMSLPNAKAAFLSTLLGLKNSSTINHRLANISVPALVIWGENDPVIPIKYANDFVTSLKDCQYIEMQNCGHTPYVEDPKRFADNILDFLDNRVLVLCMKKFMRKHKIRL
ncbi:MAG: alpha/beta hydrolase [Nitrosopumilus sp.]|nr:alpha/beta hydrolase [Nitrosopumilus sp.]MDH3822286.1 alpha/beta hydrolase [Nitrosopumilus sp.]MDH3833087.1 alpha/beta hydrolase [Nitrosopumilus sp.]